MRQHLRKGVSQTMKIARSATSANLGPGFDSCGMLSYKNIFHCEIWKKSDRWEILHELGQ